MTGTPPDAAETGASAGVDFEDPSELPVEEVRDVFLTLSKTLRAYQLYDPNNPVFKKFLENLRESFSRVWETRDSLQILVEEERFTWMGEEVYRNENRSESLAFLFFRDGIRDLTFRSGVEEEELDRFLGALHEARHARREGDDLASILWDLDLQLFGYSAVNLAADQAELPSLGEPAPLDVSGVLEGELGAGADAPAEEAETGGRAAPGAPETVRTEDFNPTLYALDEEEKRYLREELGKELSRDLRTDVLNALFDRLEEGDRPDRQEEILEILRTLLPNFLGRGELAAAARVIEEIGTLRSRDGVFSSETDELSERLVDDLSAPDAVEELVRAIEDGSVAPSADELARLLRYLRAGALEPLLKASEETEIEAARTVLREAIHGIAEQHGSIVVRLLRSSDPSVAKGAVRLVGRMGFEDAAGALAKLLTDGHPEVRLVVIEVAEAMQSSVLAAALVRVLHDDTREVRIEAARVLGRLKYGPAASDLRKILDGKELRQADITEKVAVFEAFGSLAGSEGVEVLDRTLNGRGFLGRRESAEMRAGAALGLGKIETEKARAALERARNAEEPVVRSAVGRALRGGEGGRDG